MTWREHAKQQIQTLDRQMPADITLAERKIVLRDNYPFGIRSGHAYKAWLKEQRIYLGKHGLTPRKTEDNRAALEELWQRKMKT